MEVIDLKSGLFRGNIYRSLDVAASGMTAQRQRMDAVSSNIANSTVTRVAGKQGPYLRRHVLMSADPQQTFATTMQRASMKLDTTSTRHIGDFDSEAAGNETPPLVKGKEIEIPNMKKNMLYDPSHPDADKDGYVVYPDVNVIEEMVDLMVASRAFEANVTVVNAAKGMITKSLEI